MFSGNPTSGNDSIDDDEDGGDISVPRTSSSSANNSNNSTSSVSSSLSSSSSESSISSSSSLSSSSSESSVSTSSSSESSVGTVGSLTIYATVNGSYGGYYTLWGSCFNSESLIYLSFTQDSGGTGYTYVPCINNTWVFNEAYYTEGYPTSVFTASQNSTSVQLTLDANTPSYTDASFRSCNQPYEEEAVQVPYFGNPSAWYKVITCKNGENKAIPYVYVPTPIQAPQANGTPGPTGYQVRFMSEIFYDSNCSEKDDTGSIVAYTETSSGHKGFLGTTRTYQPGDWVTWEWSFDKIWDIRSSGHTGTSYFARDLDLQCVPAFTASANFVGNVVAP